MAIKATFAEETTDPHYADKRGFYKVELWSKDDQRIARLLHAQSHGEGARCVHRGRQASPSRALYDPAGYPCVQAMAGTAALSRG
jgi:hypothetical protein